MAKTEDETELYHLQVQLVRYQQWAMEAGQRAIVVFEGRDAAGKDGVIKRITEHMAPRNTRVVALPKPSDRQKTEWYFQRYVVHLPAAGEVVIFNRSWYNRAGVEPVMGFCAPTEHKAFLRDAPEFEDMLVSNGIRLLKIWLDISKAEQAERLEARRTDPVKALKVSPLDAVAQEKWDDYSRARDQMLEATHTDYAPWTCVITDHKKKARPAVIRFLLSELAPKSIADDAGRPDPDILFRFDSGALDRLHP